MLGADDTAATATSAAVLDDVYSSPPSSSRKASIPSLCGSKARALTNGFKRGD